jgi:probable rRNA maturation factor
MRIQIADQQERLRVSRDALRRVVRAAFAGRRGVDEAAYDEVSLALVDDQAIRRLNATYRATNRATDVLAFDLRSAPEQDTGIPRLGEVVISTDRVAHQAASGVATPAEELARLTIHGCLHLQGFDHHRDSDRRTMRREEERILETLRPALRELCETRSPGRADAARGRK